MDFPVKEKFPELNEYNLSNFKELYGFSVQHSDLFWGKVAKSRVQWFKEFDEVCSTTTFNENVFDNNWFKGGKLNVAVNCVDRHYLKNPENVALIWEKDEPGTEEYFTYRQLYETINQIANMLKAYGVKKGDCVSLYVHTSIYAIAAMFACARIGAVHNFIYAEFPPHAIAYCIHEAKSVALFTDNQAVRGGKIVELKRIADQAVELCPSIKHTFVIDRTNASYETNKTVISLKSEILNYSTECEPEVMDSEDPLFIIFTSGSTGQPKAIVQSQAGFLVPITLFTKLNSADGVDNPFLVLADIAWIASHSNIIYGPLSLGLKAILFDSVFLYPNPGRIWEVIERYKVIQLAIHPTTVRILMKYGDQYLKKYDLRSLKLLIIGGEPVTETVVRWLYDNIGNKDLKISEVWGCTEFGGILAVRPYIFTPSNALYKIGMIPIFGCRLALLDDSGNELPNKNSNGHLCVKSVFPCMARTTENNREKYLETYLKPFPGFFHIGDRGSYDENGFLFVNGREDDLIKIKTLRIGASEIEQIVNTHDLVVDSAVVACPHEILGWSPYVFFIVKDDKSKTENEIIEELKVLLETKIATFALPTHYLIVDDLPKTRSCKITRRVLRKIAENNFDNLGDLASVENGFCLDSIIEKHKSKYPVETINTK